MDQGRSWRSHDDVDVGICRIDAPSLTPLLDDWEIHVAASGQLRRWRGEALWAQGALAPALAEWRHGIALAHEVGRVSLQRELHGALARASAASGQHDAAQQHAAQAHALCKAIETSLIGSGLAPAAARSLLP